MLLQFMVTWLLCLHSFWWNQESVQCWQVRMQKPLMLLYLSLGHTDWKKEITALFCSYKKPERGCTHTKYTKSGEWRKKVLSWSEKGRTGAIPRRDVEQIRGHMCAAVWSTSQRLCASWVSLSELKHSAPKHSPHISWQKKWCHLTKDQNSVSVIQTPSTDSLCGPTNDFEADFRLAL